MNITPPELIFTMLVAFIAAAACAIIPGAASKMMAVPDTTNLITSQLQVLDTLKSVSGNGATLVVAPDATNGGSTITAYLGRPNGGVFVQHGGALPTDARMAVGGNTSFAIMESSEGEIVELPYAGGTTAAWPTCTTFTIAIGTGAGVQNMTVDCADAGQGG